jgi:hypothetical protein
MVLVFMAASVCAQTSDAGILSSLTGYFDKTKVLGMALIDIFKIGSIGLVTFSVIVALQYIGLDVIGFVFGLLFWFFDLQFSLLRAALASEGNLVAFIIIFILIWLSFMSF